MTFCLGRRRCQEVRNTAKNGKGGKGETSKTSGGGRRSCGQGTGREKSGGKYLVARRRVDLLRRVLAAEEESSGGVRERKRGEGKWDLSVFCGRLGGEEGGGLSRGNRVGWMVKREERRDSLSASAVR